MIGRGTTRTELKINVNGIRSRDKTAAADSVVVKGKASPRKVRRGVVRGEGGDQRDGTRATPRGLEGRVGGRAVAGEDLARRPGRGRVDAIRRAGAQQNPMIGERTGDACIGRAVVGEDGHARRCYKGAGSDDLPVDQVILRDRHAMRKILADGCGRREWPGYRALQKWAGIGALSGLGGSALYTYKLRHRRSRRY